MFKKKTQSEPLTDFPSGTYLKTELGFFLVVNGNRRFRFITKRVLDSWSPQVVVSASESDPAVRKLKVSAKVKFRNGSLLYSQADGKMYLVSENKLRHITNPDILVGIGRRRQDAVWVSLAELRLHEEGEPLN